MEQQTEQFTLLQRISRYLKVDMLYVLKGSFWITVNQVILTLTSFSLSVIYANYLSQDTLGTYKYVISVAGFFAIATLPGMGTSVTQAVARGIEGDFIPALKTRMSWGLLGGLASLITAAYYYFHSNMILGFSFVLVALFVPFMDVFNIYDALLSGKKEFRKSSYYYAVSQITATVISALAALYTHNLYALIIAYFCSWTVLRVIYTLRIIYIEKINSLRDPTVLSNGKHLTFINIINVIASQIDKVLVFQLVGSSALAIYSVVTAPLDQVKNLVVRALSTLAMPKYAVKSEKDLKHHVFSWTWKLAIILIPVTIVYVFIAPPIFHIFFPKYYAYVFYTQLYALTLIPSLFFLPNTALNAHMAKKELYYFNFVASVAQIVILVVFAYMYGLIGVLVARIIARFFNLLVSLVLLARMKSPATAQN